MNIKFKILEVNPADHSIVVRYYSDTVTEADLAVLWGPNGNIIRTRTDVNLNIWQVPAPEGDELNEYILKHAPVAFLQLQDQIKNPEIDTSLETIKPLIGVEITNTDSSS